MTVDRVLRVFSWRVRFALTSWIVHSLKKEETYIETFSTKGIV